MEHRSSGSSIAHSPGTNVRCYRNGGTLWRTKTSLDGPSVRTKLNSVSADTNMARLGYVSCALQRSVIMVGQLAGGWLACCSVTTFACDRCHCRMMTQVDALAAMITASPDG
jgi:hypothetical protein